MTAFTIEYSELEINKRIDLLAPACVLNIDLSLPIVSIPGLEGFMTAFAVFYYDRQPVGIGILPINGDHCLASDIEEASCTFEKQVQRVKMRDYLDIRLLTADSSITPATDISVIIPTCGRPKYLRCCLQALQKQTLQADRIIVVDNCPDNSEITQIIKDDYPSAEFIVCTTRGASAARNAGAALCDSEYLAFLDDDVIPSPQWLEQIRNEICKDKRIAVARGMVLPAEIKNETQAKMEALGGFNGGFRSRWILPDEDRNAAYLEYLDFPRLGAGCQLIVRRAVFEQIGGFDPLIGAGLGIDGEDVDLFARLIDCGYIFYHEPSAIVFHHHRESEGEFVQQIHRAAWSTAYLWGRMAQRHARLRASLNKLYRKYLRIIAGQAAHASLRPDILGGKVRRKKLWCYLRGYLHGRFSHANDRPDLWPEKAGNSSQVNHSVAVRQLDLYRQIPPFLDSNGHQAIEVQIFCGEKYISSLRMPATHSQVAVSQVLSALSDEIIDALIVDLQANRQLHACPGPYSLINAGEQSPFHLHKHFYWHPSVSIVIPTRDRPDDLVDCLWRISRQDYHGELEVIVVDNNPGSGLSRPVVDQFPQFTYTCCDKPGAAATRNTGFLKARGEIIAITDDDVLVPRGWVRNIVQRFWRQDVWMVNGSVLAYELSSRAELDFEDNCGFPSNNSTIEATGEVIRSWRYIPAVMFGVSANMAFRRSVIENPAIGLMNEALGPGTPAGAGEDLEFIYRVLKEGHTVIFEPTIWAYHRHRRSQQELNRQIYNYGKSATALYLHMLVFHHDFVAIPALLFHVPKNLIRLPFIFGGRYWLIGLHGIRGYLTGFPAYIWSLIRDRHSVPGRKHGNR